MEASNYFNKKRNGTKDCNKKYGHKKATLMIDHCTLTDVCLDEHLIISSNGCEIQRSSRLHKQSIMQIKSVVLSYQTVAKMPSITG